MKYFRILVLLCFFGCQNDTQFEFEKMPCEALGFSANTSIETIKSLFSYRGPIQIENDLIIEGYVVSNDRAGNFYKSVSIQDLPENPTSAISLAIDASNLYTHYEVGRKVLIKLKGLAIGIHFGRLQIGQIVNGEMNSISSFEYKNHVFRSCEVAELIPVEIDVNEIDESYLDMFVAFSKVQFDEFDIDKTYGDPKSNKSIDRSMNCYGDACEYQGAVPLRTSGFADFKNLELPKEGCRIQGVLQNYYKEFQLVLRDEQDVHALNPRCPEQDWNANVPMVELIDLYKGSIVEFGIDDEIIVEGFVVSTDVNGNFEKRIVIQDAPESPTAGIQVLIDDSENFEKFSLGERIVLKLNRLYMDKVDGNLSVGVLQKGKVSPINIEEISKYVFGSKEVFEIVPTVWPVDEVVTNGVKLTLVKVEDVQLDSLEIGKAFAYYSGEDDGVRNIMSCGVFGGLKIFTNGAANFASEKFPTDNGSVIGVLGSYLELRSKDDFEEKTPRELCAPFKPLILISEIADPINNVGARFVELYNAGEIEISLSGWKLEKFQNGSLNVASGAIDLSEIQIAPNSFVVLANTEFQSVFGIQPTLESSYITGNGDDVYRLVDHSEKVVDIYGVLGEDGTGKNWEYLDGGAIRKLEVGKPSKIFDFKEWIISSKANNFLINHSNTPKYAPKDYLPFFE